MSDVPEEQEAVHRQADVPSSNTPNTSAQTVPEKRPADDEVQFISSNPIKKQRPTGQLTDHMAQGPMAPPPRPLKQTPFPGEQTAVVPRAPPVERRRSLCGVVQGTVPVPTLENRGASLPVLEHFAFPQSFSSLPSQPHRLSEAISPKQLPQAFSAASEAGVNTNQAPPPAPSPVSQTSVTLDQISCLDFNGIPTNTPGFDVSRIFSADGGLMSAVGVADMTPTTQSPSPTNPFSGQNAIPFAMYSTGSLVPMMLTHGNARAPASFPNLPMPSQRSTPCPSLSSQSRPQQGMPATGPDNIANIQGSHPTKAQHQPGQPQVGNTALSRSFSPAPGPKPPCLHCARIRQQNLLRQAQGSVQLPGNSTQPHRPASQQHSCHPPNAPVSNNMPPPQQPSIPRSTPAPEQQRLRSPAPFSAPIRPPTPARTNPYPALLQDMAQTVQSTFPYAQVAARHGVLPDKVAEVLASMVITPLLRGAGRPPGVG